MAKKKSEIEETAPTVVPELEAAPLEAVDTISDEAVPVVAEVAPATPPASETPPPAPTGEAEAVNSPPPPPEDFEDLKPRGRGQGQAGKKRGQYKRGDGPRPVLSDEAPPVEKAFDAELARRAGEQTGQMVIALVAQFKPDAAPQTDLERQMATMAVKQTGQFFVDKQLGDLPPGLALVAAWGAFYGTILTAERNREATKNFWTGLKSKFAQWRAARKAKRDVEKADK
jgi:hypothetical protein